MSGYTDGTCSPSEFCGPQGVREVKIIFVIILRCYLPFLPLCVDICTSGGKAVVGKDCWHLSTESKKKKKKPVLRMFSMK